MKFDELDAKMRLFETTSDHCVLPDMWMVARLDGRSFTRLTREILMTPKGAPLEAPFDDYFKGLMVDTTQYLMTDSNVSAVYSYTQSDEISILLTLDNDDFGRKIRKLNSILAGEASAWFSFKSKYQASFDCRISELPTAQNVIDYFRWRQEDATRNALSGHCYWTLRKKGLDVKEATNHLSGLSNAERNELLFQHGINFNDLPNWQKRGIGIYWTEIKKPGFNPKKQEPTVTTRRDLVVDENLPMRDEYSSFIAGLLTPKNKEDANV